MQQRSEDRYLLHLAAWIEPIDEDEEDTSTSGRTSRSDRDKQTETSPNLQRSGSAQSASIANSDIAERRRIERCPNLQRSGSAHSRAATQ